MRAHSLALLGQHRDFLGKGYNWDTTLEPSCSAPSTGKDAGLRQGQVSKTSWKTVMSLIELPRILNLESGKCQHLFANTVIFVEWGKKGMNGTNATSSVVRPIAVQQVYYLSFMLISSYDEQADSTLSMTKKTKQNKKCNSPQVCFFQNRASVY